MQILPCTKLGRDKTRPVRLFLPSRDTATGYNFLESLFKGDGDEESCGESASKVQIGQHVMIYSNFADIMQRVSKDECSVGVVPHMIAKNKIEGRLSIYVWTCSLISVCLESSRFAFIGMQSSLGPLPTLW